MKQNGSNPILRGSGFTLVEVMVASALMAGLVLASMAFFQTQLRSGALSNEALQFENLVQTIQSTLDYGQSCSYSMQNAFGGSFAYTLAPAPGGNSLRQSWRPDSYSLLPCGFRQLHHTAYI